MKTPLKKGKILFLASLVLMVIIFNFYQKEVKNLFYSLSSPVQKNLWNSGENTSNFFKGIFEKNELLRENENLKSENQELFGRIASLTYLEQENNFLKEALDLGLNKEFELIMAEVSSKDIFQDVILINKGTQDGIDLNFPVITEKKVLVGRISEVYTNFSKVMLISNKDSSFDSKIMDKDIYGVVKGEGGGKLYIDLVPKDKNILTDDIVTTAVLGGVFPKNLLVGRIGEVNKIDVNPFQTAEIIPTLNIGELNKIFIITGF